MSKLRVNWHTATVSAIRLTLLDYEDILEYQTEYILSPKADNKQGQRIDLLIIKKRTGFEIPVLFARFFREFNVFEIKGRHDALGTDAYYRAIGYVSQLIYMTGSKNQYTSSNVTLSFVTQSYPRDLIKHLKSRRDVNGKRQIFIEKTSRGIYYISGETYCTQLIIMNELSAEEYRYMRCLCSLTLNQSLFNAVVKDCSQNHDNPIYDSYAKELLHAVGKKKEDVTMYEAIFELFGTSSEEIAANATKEAEIKIHELTLKNTSLTDENASLTDENASLTDENASLTGENASLSEEVSRLRALLAKHNIPIP